MLTQKLSPRALALAAFFTAITWSAAPARANPEDAHAAPAPAPKAAPAKPAAPKAVTTPETPKADPAPKPATPKPAAKPAKPPAADDTQPDLPRTAEEALKSLTEGNDRWVSGNTLNPHTGLMRRKLTADDGQKPFAAVLTCADSRIPLERVFDAGVGDVFAIRVAGNVSGPHEAGTIEYGVDHLGVPLLVVMGHSKCGAVRAAADTTSAAYAPGNLDSLITAIKPAVDRARKMNPTADPEQLAAAAARENVWQSIFDLYKTSPQIIDMVRSGKVKVVGALLDVSTGKVDWMGEHPWQDAIISAFTPAAPAQGGAGVPPAAVAPVPTKIATPEPATAESH